MEPLEADAAGLYPVSTGEIYRLLTSMDKRHSAELSEIKEQVKITNGRTTKLEGRVENHEYLIQANKNRLDQPPPPMPPDLVDVIDFARTAKGVFRFLKWFFGLLLAASPFVAFWMEKTGRVSLL